MGKISEITSGVFLTITGTKDKKSLYDIFLKLGPENPSRDLLKYTKKYETMVNENKTAIQDMALLEELIIQMRCKENISRIQLSILRGEYIYAVAPFFRQGNKMKDIRVLISKTEFEGSDTNRLYQNTEFMNLCHTRLVAAMDNVIKSNKKILQSIL